MWHKPVSDFVNAALRGMAGVSKLLAIAVLCVTFFGVVYLVLNKDIDIHIGSPHAPAPSDLKSVEVNREKKSNSLAQLRINDRWVAFVDEMLEKELTEASIVVTTP